MKKTTLKLTRQTLATLTSNELQVARGGTDGQAMSNGPKSCSGDPNMTVGCWAR